MEKLPLTVRFPPKKGFAPPKQRWIWVIPAQGVALPPSWSSLVFYFLQPHPCHCPHSREGIVATTTRAGDIFGASPCWFNKDILQILLCGLQQAEKKIHIMSPGILYTRCFN